MEQIWPLVLELLKTDIKETSFDRWFNTILSVERQSNAVYIHVPDQYAQSYMEQAFSQIIKTNLQLVTKEPLDVRFINAEEEETNIGEDLYADIPLNSLAISKNMEQTAPSRFNPTYTFNSFVVGASNRFAHAAAMAVAERPSRTYNPLFIYGGSGLGKTHLMHAIAQNILSKNPSAKVVYISTEAFTNEFISLVRMGKLYSFKTRYRNADVFLIDDIQFLTGKQGTQEEFFHTFNALYEAGKQIVISSDRPPKEIEMLEERLRSRFEWGLITDIQLPDVETRCAILQRKALQGNVSIPEEVIFFIADKIISNIRELEGALNKVVHFTTLNRIKTITIADAHMALKDILPEENKMLLTIDGVQKTVADYFNIQVESLKSKKRDNGIVYPRQIAMYLCRDLMDEPLAKIGKQFGGRDHSTVIHSCEKIEQGLLYDPKLEKIITQLKEKLS